MTGWGIRAGVVSAIAAGVVLVAALPAGAVPANTVGTYPVWSASGSSKAFSGTADFASPTLADVTFTSDSNTLGSASGSSAFLGPATGFGAALGSTRAQPYLTLETKDGSFAPVPPSTTTPTPSTTTFTFTSAPQAGWGFALGDIDADWAQVIPISATGTDLPVALLNAQTPANYCAVTPKPSSCSGAATDVPHWVPGPGTVDAVYGGTTITWQPGTVYGNVLNTTGAYIWFLPDPQVRGVRISYGALSGAPNFQLWIGQPAPQTTISGSVAIPGTTAVPSGTAVQLDATDGTPVAGLDGQPVTAPVAPDGTFSLVAEQRTAYQIQVLPPSGYTAPAPVTVSALSAATSVPLITLDPTAGTAPAVTPTGPTLAASGIDPAPALASGLAVLLLGAGLLTARRLRRR